jgi:hypothetical protein
MTKGMKNCQNVICLDCGFRRAFVILELKYNGFRGRCDKCGGDWPES